MSDERLFELRVDQQEIAAGGEVTGRLAFAHPPHEKLAKVKAVTIELRASVSGSGDRESVVGAKAVLHQGPVTLGELPFRLRVPATGPVSFQGRYVKIVWEVIAELDIPWAIDPKAVQPVVVTPRRATGSIANP